MKRLGEEIKRLSREKDAIIVAHNYQPKEIQDIADYVGDSLELSVMASKTSAKVVVFCGVLFMAETASIMCPKKSVILPKMDAGCPLADTLDVETLKELKKEYEPDYVVCYVNSSASVKAESDICCTSANCLKIVKSLSGRILVVPDKNLGSYVRKCTGKDVIVHPGFCPVHEDLEAIHVRDLKEKFQDALLLSHPECRDEVLSISDFVLGTSGMLKVARKSDKKRFIIGTEIGLIYRLKKENKNKEFIPAKDDMICPDMKKISLQDIYVSLKEMKNIVKVDKDIADKAKRAIEKMFSYI